MFLKWVHDFLLRLSCVAVNNIIGSFFFLPKTLWPCMEVFQEIIDWSSVFLCAMCVKTDDVVDGETCLCHQRILALTLCLPLSRLFSHYLLMRVHLQPPFNEKRHSKIIISAVEDFVSLSSMVYWERGQGAKRNTVKQTAKKAKISSVTKLWLILLYNCDGSGSGMVWNLTGRTYMLHLYGQAAVTYRFPLDHRSQAPSSGASTWMGDHPGTPRAVGNTWCTRHMTKPRPQVGRVCQFHHQNTPQFTAKKCDWSLDLRRKKNPIIGRYPKTVTFSMIHVKIILSELFSLGAVAKVCRSLQNEERAFGGRGSRPFSQSKLQKKKWAARRLSALLRSAGPCCKSTRARSSGVHCEGCGGYYRMPCEGRQLLNTR